MLTLEQVRAVNDGLKSGDIHAALRPLEETIDLRHAELPRLEKSALAALKTGLQTPETAQIWAEAAFHPNVSVRRFVRKTLLGLKSDAAPVAAPLQKRLEQFWAQETPLAESMKPREAALRREQTEIVQSAVEILLRADPETFIAFYGDVLNELPLEKDRLRDVEAWQARQRAYSEAVKKRTDGLICEEWGDEYLQWEKRSQLPWRIWREIGERVQNAPEIQKLLADLGESPWQRASQQWNPNTFFQSAMSEVLQPDATGPQQAIAAVLRPHFWRWIEAAFDEKLAPRDGNGVAARAQRAHHAMQSFWQWERLGREELWERIPPLLTKSKPSLLSEIQATFTLSYPYRVTRGTIWSQLALALAGSCHKPYRLKGADWTVPPHITPELLRGLKVKPQPSRDYFNRPYQH